MKKKLIPIALLVLCSLVIGLCTLVVAISSKNIQMLIDDIIWPLQLM